jgi:hyperosmotically inducible periplasmic protein
MLLIERNANQIRSNMMKTTINTSLKPFALAIAISLGFSAGAAFADEADTFNNASWQSPAAAEFAALDTTGNGLLLPNEASKGKAFNKKTFAKADADHDGYIDQNEYIYFKTGAWPDAAKTSIGAAETDLPEAAQATTTAEGDAVATAESAGAEKRTVGKVIDDTIITAKAKAEILKAPDLKSLQISVETRNGEVILSGFVDSAASKLQAEELVSKIEGVKSINNSLVVKM